MTCIVALYQGKKLYIGADSAGTSGNLAQKCRNDRKIFKNRNFMMGFAGSYRMGQVLAYNFDPPGHRYGDDMMKFMVKDFIPSAKECLKTHGGDDDKGHFLVCYCGRIYHIYSDFQVEESLDDFDACGSGEDVALGSLRATREWKDPMKRLEEALEAAERYNAAVRRPFHFETMAE